MSKCDQCIVRELSSLKALDKNELKIIANCKTSYTIKKGKPIFEEGEKLKGVFCVKEGVCKMTKLSSNGKDQIIKFVKAGEILGQRSMISEEVTNLSAFAVEDMEVCFIPKSEIIDRFNNNNKFSLELMKNICGDLKGADDQLVSFTQKNVSQRLAETILYIENVFGIDENGYIKVQLSRDEISGMIGTATESCIRILSEFKKNKILELTGKKIKILNKNALKKSTH